MRLRCPLSGPSGINEHGRVSGTSRRNRLRERRATTCRCLISRSRFQLDGVGRRLSVLLGFQTRFGAWLLVIFLVPVTMMMHNFWAVSDPATSQIERAIFIKTPRRPSTARE
jgi:hypothetical protein